MARDYKSNHNKTFTMGMDETINNKPKQ